jgi:hypothetical protein
MAGTIITAASPQKTVPPFLPTISFLVGIISPVVGGLGSGGLGSGILLLHIARNENVHGAWVRGTDP